jgi:hypothetical protein
MGFFVSIRFWRIQHNIAFGDIIKFLIKIACNDIYKPEFATGGFLRLWNL